MVIGVKVFEYELAESSSSPNSSKIDYTLDDILHNRAECAFVKIHRLVFQSQSQNIAFTEELFAAIVRLLYRERKAYTDGIAGTAQARDADGAEEGKPHLETLDVFDYESVVAEPQLSELRASNLRRFIEQVLKEVILKNIDP